MQNVRVHLFQNTFGLLCIGGNLGDLLKITLKIYFYIKTNCLLAFQDQVVNNLKTSQESYRCVKNVRIWSFLVRLFRMGLNTERSFVSFCIQSEFGKIRTRKTQNIDTIHVLTIVMSIKVTSPKAPIAYLSWN